MDTPLKIGIHGTPFCQWQADALKTTLKELGYEAQIIAIEDVGTLYVESLHAATLKGHVDISLHVLSEVPAVLPDDIVQAAVLPRDRPQSSLVYKKDTDFMQREIALIGANKRSHKAQWLNRYQGHKITDFNDAINAYMQGMSDKNWDGMVLADSDLMHMDEPPTNRLILDWMVPAPAQGTIMLTGRREDERVLAICAQLNDDGEQICAQIEREFLALLGGGHTLPVAAWAQINKGWLKGGQVEFKGMLLTQDGSKKLDVELSAKVTSAHTIAKDAAQIIMEKGGRKLLSKQTARSEEKPPTVLDDLAKKVEGTSNDNQITVLSTQDLSGEEKTYLDKDIKVQGMDFISFRFREIAPEVVRTDSMIITSQTVVRSLLTSFPMLNWRFKNIYCIGEKTKILVEERLGRVIYTAPSSEKLAQYLCDNMGGRAITLFCSSSRQDELPAMLSAQGIKVTEVVTYDADYIPHTINSDFSGVIFYSPSAIRSYVQTNAADKTAFCIDENTAAEAQVYFKEIKTAKHPTMKSVMDLVNSHFG